MWGDHAIYLPIVEVEFTKLQCFNFILVSMNCAYPLQELHSDQGILKISGHIVLIDCVAQRW
jgi:hypothetical protein